MREGGKGRGREGGRQRIEEREGENRSYETVYDTTKHCSNAILLHTKHCSNMTPTCSSFHPCHSLTLSSPYSLHYVSELPCTDPPVLRPSR